MSVRGIYYLVFAVSLVAVTAWLGKPAYGAETAPAEPPEAASDDDGTPDAVADDDAVVGDEDGAAEEAAAEDVADADPESTEPLDLFEAEEEGSIEIKFVAKSDKRGRIIVRNVSDMPVELRVPTAFVGVPVVSQLGGGGGGGGGGQAVGGGGGGGAGGGGGGGQFSIPPEDEARIDVALLCLDHGKKNPSSSKPYELIPAEDHLGDQPAVIELLEAFGRGELQRGAAQAAVWNLNSGVTWQELAAKLDGTVRSFVRSPYFAADEITMAVAYVNEAVRRAALRPEAETPEADESLSSY